MRFEQIDNLEEWFNEQRRLEAQANEQLTDAQRELRDDVQHTRHWVRVYEDLAIFGEAWSEQDTRDSSERLGLDEDELIEEVGGIMQSRERGYVFGRCYSVITPEGELGSTHVGHAMPISRDTFELARECGWAVHPLTERRMELAARLVMEVGTS